MSSMPEPTLEDFVGDCFYFDSTNAEEEYLAQIKAWEPARAYIEEKMREYDPEEQSWRTYRNTLAEMVHELLAAKQEG